MLRMSYLVLKLMIENVIFVIYQSKNVFRNHKHPDALAPGDGDTTSEPFSNKVPVFELLRD